nr:putative capsid protein [Cressdnaviricota sp.]
MLRNWLQNTNYPPQRRPRNRQTVSVRATTVRRVNGSDNVQGRQNSYDAAGNAITAQHDVVRAYMRKRRRKGGKKAYKKRKRAKRFKIKVKKALSPTAVTYHYNERASAWFDMPNMPTIWGTEPSQQFMGSLRVDDGLPGIFRSGAFRLFEGLPLTGDYNDSSTSCGVGRYFAYALGVIAERYSGSDQTPPTDWLQTFKAYIKHCGITFSIYNNQAGAVNVDIYEFIAARNIARNDFYSTPCKAMTRIRTTDAIYFSTSMTNVTAMTDYGATPFDFPGLSKHWKVNQKVTVYLPAGSQTNVQFKGSKGMWDGKLGQDCCAFKGKTREYVFVVGSKIGWGMNDSSAPIKVAFEKTYKIKPPIGTQYAKPNFLSTMSYKYNSV